MSPKTQQSLSTVDHSKGCQERWGCAVIGEGKEELSQCPRGEDFSLFHNLAVLPLTSRSVDAHVEKCISRSDNYKKGEKTTQIPMLFAGVCFIAPHLACWAMPLPTSQPLPNQSSY